MSIAFFLFFFMRTLIATEDSIYGSKYYIEEITIPSIQEDKRFCRNELNHVFGIYHHDHIRLRYASPLRITGVKCRKNINAFPIWNSEFCQQPIQLQYKLYTMFDWVYRQEIFWPTSYEPEETGGPHVYNIEPSFIASDVRIFVNNPLNREIFLQKVNLLVLLGCPDEEGIKDLQYIGKGDVSDNFDKWRDGIQPNFEDGCSIFNFEEGNIEKWKIEGDAFKYQPTYGDNKYYREKKFITKFLGNWWISSFELHPNSSALHLSRDLALDGTLESPPFIINATKLSFLIGGGDTSGKIGVEIRIFKKTVKSLYLDKFTPQMIRQTFDLSLYMFKPATLLLVDKSETGYLMFDDLRTVGQCNDECDRSLGMTSGDIGDTRITGSAQKRENALIYPPHYARLSHSISDEKYYRNSLSRKTWLKINLPVVTVLDGWATQGFQLNLNSTECSFPRYTVRYSDDDFNWRFLSVRVTKDKNFEIMPIIYTHKNGEINRIRLNPRITVKSIIFALYPEGSVPLNRRDDTIANAFVEEKDIDSNDNEVCLRIELYGCPKQKFEDGSMVTDKKFQTLKEKLVEDNYELKVFIVPRDFITDEKELQLTCTADYIILELTTKFEWYEAMQSSNIRIAETTPTFKIKLLRYFRQRIFGCRMYYYNNVLLVREYLVLEKRYEVISFVTHEPSIHLRGGRLSHTNPTILYNEEGNKIFFSVHFINIAEPGYRLISKDKDWFYCPNKGSYFSPNNHYIYHGVQESKDACFQLALKNGSKTFFYQTNQLCYSGEALWDWMWPSDRARPECEIIYSWEDKEFGAPCQKTCNNVKDDIPTGNFYAIIYGTKAASFRLEISIYGKTLYSYNKPIYSRQYDIKFDAQFETFITNLFPQNKPDGTITQEQEKDVYKGVEGVDNAGENPQDITDGAACLTYYSPYLTQPWGSSSILTFIYSCRFKNTYNRELYSVHLGHKSEYGSWKSDAQSIEVRYRAEPYIDLPNEIGICSGEYAEIIPKIVINDFTFNARHLLQYNWGRVTEATYRGIESLRNIPFDIDPELMMYQINEKLIFYEAKVLHSGIYELLVKSPFGEVAKRIKVNVYNDFPRILWITPSPHIVIEKKTDILAIEVNSNEQIKDIIWKINGITINESNQYSFLDYKGKRHERKRLLLKRLNHEQQSGKYEVDLVGEYCHFSGSVEVDVTETPTLSMTSSSNSKDFMICAFGSTNTITADINYGYPEIKTSDMVWTKNGQKIMENLINKLTIQISRPRSGSWRSTLTLFNMDKADQGEYVFTVSTRFATLSEMRNVYVTSNKKEELLTSIPGSTQQISCNSTVVMFFLICAVIKIAS